MLKLRFSKRGFAGLCILFLMTWQAPVAAAEPVKIGATRTAILLWLTDELGYFAKEGVDVDAQLYDSGTQTAKDINEGRIDLATSSEFAFVSNAFERPDFRILASLSASQTTDFVARSDRGIKELADLVGKRIALTKSGIGEYFLGRQLILNRLSLSDVKIVDLPPPKIVDAIAEGRVDAGLTWEPFVYSAAERLGDNHVILPGQGGQDFFFLLYTTSAWLSGRQDDVRKILRGLVNASHFAHDQPEEAKNIVAGRLGFDPTFTDHMWPKHRLTVTLSQNLLRIMEDEAEWRIKNGLSETAAIPNYLEMIHSAPLASIDPSAVTIFGRMMPAAGALLEDGGDER